MASPLLSVIDNALHPENVSAETFDGEGTPTRQVALIEKGGAERTFSTAPVRRNAWEPPPTGHASIGAKVSVGPNFYQVLPGGVC